eukprot:4931392-Ditylum_brightwellii.AAC.1
MTSELDPRAMKVEVKDDKGSIDGNIHANQEDREPEFAHTWENTHAHEGGQEETKIDQPYSLITPERVTTQAPQQGRDMLIMRTPPAMRK